MVTADGRNEGGLVVAVALLAVIMLAVAAPGVQARAATDPCSRGDLFPMAVSQATFDSEPDHKPVPGTIYTLWDQDYVAPGRFGWLYWVDGNGVVRGTPPQNPTMVVLEDNLVDTTRSGAWRVGDWVHGMSGATWPSSILNALDWRINGPLVPTVTVTICDAVQGSGSDVHLRMVRYGAFRLVCAKSSLDHYVERQPGDCDPCMEAPSLQKCLRGYFVRGAPGATVCSNIGP